MEEPQSIAAVLREVLARDRSLLGRRDELLAALDARAQEVNVFEYGSLKRALRDSTVGDTLLAADGLGDEAQAQAIAEAVAVLRSLGMQERVVHRVVDTIVSALAWGEEPVAPEPTMAEPVEVLPPEISSFVPAPSAPLVPAASPVWMCTCGQTGNRGRFCVGCGRARTEGDVHPEDFWTCICGHAKNRGRFCVSCGRSQDEGDARTHPTLVWACACGHRGNQGNFCVACGRSRAEGEVQLWDCVCGHTGNIGNFCVACGRSRANGAY